MTSQNHTKRRKNHYFLKILGGNGSKKGAKTLFYSKMLLVLDAKFNVDYDFAIIHDLIL